MKNTGIILKEEICRSTGIRVSDYWGAVCDGAEKRGMWPLMNTQPTLIWPEEL